MKRGAEEAQEGPPRKAAVSRSSRRRQLKRQKEKEERAGSSSARSGSSLRYGNFPGYYGYRNTSGKQDPRLTCMLERSEWFQGKDVLDVGCNTGLFTIQLAEASKCRSCLGVDIDGDLVRRGRQAVKKVVMDMIQDAIGREEEYPASLSRYPNFHVPPSTRFLELHRAHKSEFPFTVRFRTENFVEPMQVLERFHTVLCLSTTKWVHLNWGDQGIKDLFARVAQQLRPGGVFLLEPQPRASYRKKKRLDPVLMENFRRLEMWPDDFKAFLEEQPEWEFLEELMPPEGGVEGFKRPLLVFRRTEAKQ